MATASAGLAWFGSIFLVITPAVAAAILAPKTRLKAAVVGGVAAGIMVVLVIALASTLIP
tara:strand:- start:5058 stop:5237 length:180 start_codon:yes stop_codon:yes gene_type:complete